MSTKTTLKRIALVAVSALGFGVLTVAPSQAATNFNATFSVPTALDIRTDLVGGTNTVANVGVITINMSTLNTPLTDTGAGVDTARVTMTPATGANQTQQDKNNALFAALTLSETTSGTTTSADTDLNNAATGYNVLNNGDITLGSAGGPPVTSRWAELDPLAASFGQASGRAYINVARASLALANSGGVVNFDLTVSANGTVQTFRQTLTLTIGAKPGTASTPVTTGTIAAGGTATVTHTQPYTNVGGTDVLSDNVAPVTAGALQIVDTFVLGGTLLGDAAGDPTFTVTAAVTGGSAVMRRNSATSISPILTKNGLNGSMSVTYTITVTAPIGAPANKTISVYGYTWTVQPYTPVYTSSTVTPTMNGNGYRVSAANGGDGIIWGSAALVGTQTASIAVQQLDQNNAVITAPAFATAVTASITGKGSLAQLGANGASTKSQAWNSTLGNLAGLTTIQVWSDGTSGEGTLTITVNGASVATYTLRFWGDAATISASLLRPIGSTAGAANGVKGGANTNTANGNVAVAAINGVTPNTVGDDTLTAIAVSVKDANGYNIPTTVAPTATISNVAVVASVTRQFVDSGVSIPTALRNSAGTFVQHYTYTTAANVSGSTATLTFTFVNAAGTALTATPVTVTLGGAAVSATLAFDKTSYSPGSAASLTFTGKDSAGNKAFDGNNLIAGGMESTLDFGSAVSVTQGNGGSVLGGFSTASTVDGKKTRATFAPVAPGAWTITGYLANGTSYSATATVTDPSAAATAAGNAATAAAKEATEAANAAADAAAEAIDAANAATDAANLSAEAADAATVAAEEARDAADAATAAVEELATQVATLMAALKAQITTLANTVAKIAKKVKA